MHNPWTDNIARKAWGRGKGEVEGVNREERKRQL